MVADAGTKSVIIPANIAGPIYVTPQATVGPTSRYYLRFRIVSDDGLMYSKWSQNFTVDVSDVIAAAGFQTLSHTLYSNASTISLAWHLKENIFASGFDVYARWNEEGTKPLVGDASWSDWTFISEVESAGASIPIPENKKWVQVYVQLRSFPKVRCDDIQILETGIYSTRSSTDSGTVAESSNS